ncbi:MAG: sulfurtransferase [Deltaproteobacteria bacterium]|nr:sulfurtransferase [Deltaproteobacteria bacterium]|tara:strand:+ start:148 stop:537 length:390 start_codon:yes stop_codon:yes gene_type:complete
MAKKHSPAFLAIVDASRARVEELTVAQVAEMVRRGEEFQFVDVREDREFSVDSCRGAMHIGKGVLERDVEKAIPDKKSRIVLYCGGGYRSALAADSLGQMGYTNVASMDGGIRGWREAGLPLDCRTEQD